MKDPFEKNDIKIAVIGGGTGSFTILSALKNHTKQLAALVNMADDGGSTGVLRDEFGTLPPGDVRQCLVALSDSSKVRELFDYRFEEGTFKGHSFGNLLLTALEKTTGNFSEAIETASDILRINGVVIPSTLDNVRLKMEWPEASLILKGERVIDANYFKYDPRRANLSLVPEATANPMAVRAIMEADLVVVAPGDLYTSIGPLLIIDGIKKALIETKAKKAYICNLVTKAGQTEGFSVSDHAAEIERFVGRGFLDYVLYNKQKPDKKLFKKYQEEQAYLVKIDSKKLEKAKYQAISGDFLGNIDSKKHNDTFQVRRSLIRHDAEAVAKVLMDLSR